MGRDHPRDGARRRGIRAVSLDAALSARDADIVRRFLAYESPSQIAADLGFSRTWVYMIVRRAGKRRPPLYATLAATNPRKRHMRMLAAAHRANLLVERRRKVEAMLADGVKWPLIARRLRLNRHTLYEDWRRQHGKVRARNGSGKGTSPAADV